MCAIATVSSTSNSATANPRDQALERAVSQIEKTYGKGAIMTMDGASLVAVDGIHI